MRSEDESFTTHSEGSVAVRPSVDRHRRDRSIWERYKYRAFHLVSVFLFLYVGVYASETTAQKLC